MVMVAVLESATSIAAANVVSLALSSRESRRSSPWIYLSGVVLVLRAIDFTFFRLAFSHALLSAQRAGFATRLAVLISGHFIVLWLSCGRPTDAVRWPLFRTSVVRAVLYVAPVYPLITIASSTILMVTISSLHLAERLHWFIHLGSLHAPFWFVHVHVQRRVFGTRPGDSSPLPRHRQDELPLLEDDDFEDHAAREQIVRQRLRFVS